MLSIAQTGKNMLDCSSCPHQERSTTKPHLWTPIHSLYQNPTPNDRDVQDMIQPFAEQLQHDFQAIEAVHVLPQETETTDRPHYTLQIIVQTYDIKLKERVLERLFTWSAHNTASCTPLFLTKQEATYWPQDAALLHPADMLTALKQDQEEPYEARRLLLHALGEFERILQQIELEFPTSGLHMWCVTEKVEIIYQQYLQWLCAMHGKEDTADTRKALLDTLCAQDGPLPEALQHLPLRLQATIERHKALATLLPQQYGENDLELSELIIPLREAIKVSKKQAHQLYPTPQRDKKRRSRFIWLTITALILLATPMAWMLIKHYASYKPAIKGFAHSKRAGGIRGAYYKGRNFATLQGCRLDRGIDYFWRNKPHSKVPKDHFSVRWNGYFNAPRDGEYRLCLYMDDGGRLYYGKNLLINAWKGGFLRRRCKRLLLRKGWHPIKAEMYEHSGPSHFRLLWSTPKNKRVRAIPARSLCCKN